MESEKIRTIKTGNSTVMYCGADISQALGYSDVRDALRYCKNVVIYNVPTSSGIQAMRFISKGDVYRLIAHSKLPDAESFESWLFDEALPSIQRKKTEDILEKALDSPDFLIELANRLKSRNAKCISFECKAVDNQDGTVSVVRKTVYTAANGQRVTHQQAVTIGD